MLPRRGSAPQFPDVDEGWFRISNLADSAQVHIYAEIGGHPDGGGVKAEQFCQEVQGIRASTIDVRLNSPGGDVFDGIAIHNALRDHPATVNVFVDGIAASIASVIAMAGDKITMARGSQMMIHEGHTAAAGTAADMARTSELLNKCSDNIATFYADRAGGTVAQWRERMRAETWYSAEEAVQVGLADEVAPRPGVRNAWDLTVFNYAGRDMAPAPDVSRAPAVQAAAPSNPDTAKPQPINKTSGGNTPPQDTWTGLIGPLLAPSNRDAVLTALREKL
jgi:ATP-dependent protease ClpP protease subunit